MSPSPLTNTHRDDSALGPVWASYKAPRRAVLILPSTRFLIESANIRLTRLWWNYWPGSSGWIRVQSVPDQPSWNTLVISPIFMITAIGWDPHEQCWRTIDISYPSYKWAHCRLTVLRAQYYFSHIWMVHISSQLKNLCGVTNILHMLRINSRQGKSIICCYTSFNWTAGGC